MLNTLQEIAFSSDYSAKRLLAFQDFFADNDAVREEMQRRTTLCKMCETRWASRADSVFTFCTAFSVVVQALESLLLGGNCKARSYLCSIRQFDFIFYVCATKHILSHTVACEGSGRTCALLCEQRDFLGSRFYIRTRTRASTHTRWSKSSLPGNHADWHLNSVHKPLLLR